MVMAAPRSNISAVFASADFPASKRLASSASANGKANGDRMSRKPVQAEAEQPLPLDDPWTSTFEALLVQTALDSLFDGVMVVNVEGDIIRVNHKAKLLFERNIPAKCSTALGSSDGVSQPHPLQPLLDEIWRVCSAVINSRTEFPQQDVVLDSEVALSNRSFRIRVRWMNSDVEEQPCLIVSIEDLLQTAVNQVNGDRWKYNLTPRETEVWQLKRRGYSYRAIAQTLYVTENTVKKHLKNIQSKRRTRGDWS